MASRLATVFGGSGFIGRHLVQRLAKEGWRVRVAVRDIEAAAFLKPRGDVGQVVPVLADVTNEASIKAAIAGAELVVNLVGALYERGGKRSFQAVHVDGAARIAAAAKTAGVKKLVHVSALGASANSPSAYARSKAAGETAVLAAFPTATILRPSVLFGPEDAFFNKFAEMSTFTPVMPVFVRSLPRVHLSGPSAGLDLFGDGGPKFQPVYVGDVADAIMAAATQNNTAGKVFELGGPHVFSFKQIIELVLSASGRKRRLVPWPLSIAKINAAFLQLLPVPPLTVDQIKLMESDNVVTPGVAGLADLGITPTAAEVIVPTYLSRFINPYVHHSVSA